MDVGIQAEVASLQVTSVEVEVRTTPGSIVFTMRTSVWIPTIVSVLDARPRAPGYLSKT